MAELEAEWSEKHKGNVKKIYFCQFDGLDHWIKIGCCNDVAARFKALAVQFPTDLKLLASFVGTHQDENRIHHYFKDYYLRNEWFEAEKPIWDMIEKINNGTFNIEDLPQSPKVSIAHYFRIKRQEAK